jgi:hypothetical protein
MNLLTSNTSRVVEVIDLRADEDDTPIFDSTTFGRQSLMELQADDSAYFALLEGITAEEMKCDLEALARG